MEGRKGGKRTGCIDIFIYLEFLKNNNTKFRRKIVGHGPFGPTPRSAHVLEFFSSNLKVHKTFASCCFSFKKAEIIKKITLLYFIHLNVGGLR